MLRVLIAIDDYNENMFIQTLLKKLGLDAYGIQSDRSLQETMLTFNPQVVIVSLKGRKFRGPQILEKIKKRNNLPRTLLLKSSGTPDPDAFITPADAIEDTPINPMSFIRTIATLGGLEPQTLIEKLSKINLAGMGGAETSGSEQRITSTIGAIDKPIIIKQSTLSIQERQNRYSKYLDLKEEPKQKTLPRGRISQAVKEGRERSKDPDLESGDQDLLRQKQQFVKSLFKK